MLNENFEEKELADMNDIVLKQHKLFRAKVEKISLKIKKNWTLKQHFLFQVKSEKSLRAIKRKRDDEVFDGFGFSLEELRYFFTEIEIERNE